MVERGPLAIDFVRHEPADDPGAVQRRNREGVEDAQDDVDLERVRGDLEGIAGEVAVGEDRARDQRQYEVRGGAGRPDERHADLRRRAQIARIHGHRLGPAEEERAAEVRDHEDQRAERVHVDDRVEREPAHVLGGAIAELVRGQAVRQLVQGQRDDEDRREQQEAVNALVAEHGSAAAPGHPATRSMRAPSARSRSSMRSYPRSICSTSPITLVPSAHNDAISSAMPARMSGLESRWPYSLAGPVITARCGSQRMIRAPMLTSLSVNTRRFSNIFSKIRTVPRACVATATATDVMSAGNAGQGPSSILAIWSCASSSMVRS